MNARRTSFGAAALVATLTYGEASRAMQCSFDTVTGIAFGSYDTFSAAPLDSTGSITFQCRSVEASDMIIVSLSKGSSNSYAARTLVQGIYQFVYNIYRDAARTMVWGDGTEGTASYGPIQPQEGTPTTLTMYGRIPAMQSSAHVGTYSDTVVVTMMF
jgi:spore coat protein U-like protein